MKKFKYLILFIFALPSISAAVFAGKSLEERTKFKNGKYKGSAKGYKGKITVAVTVTKGRIDRVEILRHRENRPGKALKEIPEKIMREQKTDVDAVSGATYTSEGIINAVKNALKKAQE